MSTGLDMSIPSSRPLTFPGGQSKNGYRARWLIELGDLSSSLTYRARWLIELGFSREEKREKMEIKAIITTWSTKSKPLSRSQFVTDKKHCVTGRLMLFWYLKKYWQKNILFYPFFFDIFDARLSSVNGAWIERFSFKTQTSQQPCFPCKNRIDLKNFKSLVFPSWIFWLRRYAISDSMYHIYIYLLFICNEFFLILCEQKNCTFHDIRWCKLITF